MAGLVYPFKEALLAAFVALLLAVPLVGFQTVQPLSGAGLELHTRWPWVAIAVAAVFAGRFIIAAVLERRRSRAPILATPEQDAGSRYKKLHLEGGRARVLRRGVQVLALAAALSVPFWANRYVLDVGILVVTYVMLGWGLNIVVGLAGLLDLGYVAFYAVGAYSFALLATHFDLGFWVCLPIAGMLAATFGLVLGFPVLRLRGDYLAIVTLGFGEMIRIVLINWYALTRGPDGIGNIPRPSFFGLPFAASSADGPTFGSFFNIAYSPAHRQIFLFYLILAMALLTNAFTLRMRRLPIGRAWEALREDEIACRSLGINPTNTKLTAFAIGAMFGGFAGCFFATRQGFISPESFSFIESAIILAIVVLGGMGSQIGVVIAAVVLIGGPELVRGLDEFRMLAFGGLMVVIMVLRPTGLVGFRQPTIRMGDRLPPPEATVLAGSAGEKASG
ncbi:MAG: high-affinity branched-chain amino acid ABC transporter permease LivM [Rhodospirillales bacterium]